MNIHSFSCRGSEKVLKQTPTHVPYIYLRGALKESYMYRHSMDGQTDVRVDIERDKYVWGCI